ncbi:MAG: SMP-30/gluconolactonase/LRE family protein [Pseudomonadota bacterium]
MKTLLHSTLALLSLLTLRAQAADDVLAGVNLMDVSEAAQVQAGWRYSDAQVVATRFLAVGADGQPSGTSNDTQTIEPRAGRAEFDDTGWAVISPDSLKQRRGNGRVSFNWYRLSLTLPESINGVDVSGKTVWFETRLDDYAEIWVNGEIGRGYGQVGGSVVSGWNAPNRVVVARNARPGQKIQVAVFGMNGPISDAPTNYIFFHEARLELVAGPAGPVAVAPHEVNVHIERVDPAINAIVPLNAKLWKLAEGFRFTEGPVWVRDGSYLLFSDPNSNRIYRYSDESGLSVFREHSGYDAVDIAEYGQPGSNGLTLDASGRLTLDEHGRHRVSRLERDGSVTVLANSYQGKRLNSPNDLVYRSDGTVYFTDPPFGLPKFDADPRKELAFSGVFRVTPAGKISLLTQEFTGPNGIAFSPDEKTLYVGNWDPAVKVVKKYPVHRDGSIGAGEVFIDLTRRIPGDEALDGIKVDKLGNVYLSAPGGVWLFDSSGKHLGTITAPSPVHNFAWGGPDGKTLYLCARSNLYRIPLLVEGVRP